MWHNWSRPLQSTSVTHRKLASTAGSGLRWMGSFRAKQKVFKPLQHHSSPENCSLNKKPCYFFAKALARTQSTKRYSKLETPFSQERQRHMAVCLCLSWLNGIALLSTAATAGKAVDGSLIRRLHEKQAKAVWVSDIPAPMDSNHDN